MNTKIWMVMALSCTALMAAGAVIGHALESAGVLTRDVLGPAGVAAVKLCFLVLAVVLAFALVPLTTRHLIRMQIAMGSGATRPIQWLQSHEAALIRGFWTLTALGLTIALPVAFKQGFFKY